MRTIGLGFVILAMVACGDEKEERRPRRIVNPGTLLNGPVGGSERFDLEDGSRINFIVSGDMTVRTPRGVFLGTAFPADVSFSVRSVTGTTITGAVSFPRLQVDRAGSFQGDVSDGTVRASIVGMFEVVTSTTVLDVQAFSYALPATNPTVRDRTVILQGSMLRDRELEVLP